MKMSLNFLDVKGWILLKADSAISSASDKHTTSFFIMVKFRLKQFHVCIL